MTGELEMVRLEGKMIEMLNNNDRYCLMCNAKIETCDLRLNRKNGDNIIRFAICSDCLEEMAQQLNNLAGITERITGGIEQMLEGLDPENVKAHVERFRELIGGMEK